MTKFVRPTKWQEAVRQWILMIPLATAVTGSLAVGSDDAWVSFLPPLFFVGALVVTASMLHQRSMAQQNLDLAERLQGANDRLDTLHSLAVGLSESLDVLPIACRAVDSLLESVEADAAALWVRRDLLPVPLLSPDFLASLPVLPAVQAGDDEEPSRWLCLCERGFAQPQRALALGSWASMMEKGLWWGQAPSEGAGVGAPVRRTPRLIMAPEPPRRPTALSLAKPVARAPLASSLPSEVIIESDELLQVFGGGNGAAVVPLMWEGEVVGALLAAAWQGGISREQVLLARDISLVAGPALQNSLSYSGAMARAEMDGLTNLYNHRVLQERLSQELSRASRALEQGMEVDPSRKLSLAIMDVTDFKIFNDTYGHGTGDKVLQYIAESLRGSFRAGDIVARYGGDEFMIVLPETDIDNASKVCRRAVDLVAGRPFETEDGSPISVRIACGVSTFPEDGTSIQELIAEADERLYAAKRAGQLMLDHADASTVAHSNAALERQSVPSDLWQGLGVFESLVAAIDSKDKYTRRHTQSVWCYVMALADELSLPAETRQALHTAALVHDVGKIVVPDAILRKPGRLSEAEMAIMQQHTSFGEQLVKDVPHLSLVQGGVRHHHEKWDGSGYPDGLQGERIPFVARVMAVPDSFAAMTIERPYRRALSHADALREIERSSGVQFDPIVVRAFARVLQTM